MSYEISDCMQAINRTKQDYIDLPVFKAGSMKPLSVEEFPT